MASSPRHIGQTLVTTIERGFTERGLAGRWSVLFPPKGGDFEIQGEGLRLIVEVNYAVDQSGLTRAVARAFKQGPVQARLRAWFLNEFVERVFDDPAEVAPVLFSILEAHRPSGQKAPTTVTGAPELDSPDRPAKGADDA